MYYTTQDSILVERLLISQGIKKCSHKHLMSDVVEIEDGEDDFCFVCLNAV